MKDEGLENLYIFLSERMVKQYKQRSQLILNELHTGITVDQWVVLKYISENNGASQVLIASSSAKDAPTTTRIIDQLVKKNLVERRLDTKDRRKFSVYTLSAGEVLVKKVEPHILVHRSQTIDGIKESELRAFISTLRKMLDNL
jgi:DNA-binding MarR family transcriptional regulator